MSDTTEQTSGGKAPGPAIVGRRGRVLIVANDNRRRDQDHVTAGGTMREPSIQLDVMRILAKVLRGFLQADAACEPIGSCRRNAGPTGRGGDHRFHLSG